MKPALRAAVTATAMAVAALAGLGVRDARLAGLFSNVTPGFAGSCRAIPGVAGGDIQIGGGLIFIAVSDPRRPGPRDGIYTMAPAGGGLMKVAGAPADFHPRALSIGPVAGTTLTLMAINVRANGTPVVDIFTASIVNGAVTLAQTSSVEGGLLVHPTAIAASGPDSFYVANDVTSRTKIGQALETYAMLPRGDVVYFAGGGLRVVADGLNRPNGLALAPDGRHLVVAATSGRDLVTFESDLFTGTLKQVDTLALPAGPDKITIDSKGRFWVAGHPDLFRLSAYARDPSARPASQIFEVGAPGGIPRGAEPVYGDEGNGIAAASVGAVAGDRLIIGSALDDKILDCVLK